MAEPKLHDLPTRDPVTGGPLYVSEVTSMDGSVTIRGKFKLPSTTRLERDQQEFLEVFLRARGVIATMEKELGLSYPTVRARLDSLLEAMGLAPYKESTRKPRHDDEKRKVLELLENGEISADEAKTRLKAMGQ
jgi:hypothetical protein